MSPDQGRSERPFAPPAGPRGHSGHGTEPATPSVAAGSDVVQAPAWWPRLTEQLADGARYAASAERETPVVILEPLPKEAHA